MDSRPPSTARTLVLVPYYYCGRLLLQTLCKKNNSNDRTLVLVLLVQWGALIVDLVVKLPSIARILVLVLWEALTVNSL